MTGRAGPSDDDRQLDLELKRVATAAALLPALTAHNGRRQRQLAIEQLRRGEAPAPRFEVHPRPAPRQVREALSRARALATLSAARDLYEARLEQLELDLDILATLGREEKVRPLAALRFGTGADEVDTAAGPRTLAAIAADLLTTVQPSDEPLLLPADGPPGEPSLGELVRKIAASAGLEVEVRVEPRLTAGAATGNRTVFVADREFGVREGLRIAIHEVLGHLTAAANGRAQPLRLFELGTAASFADQEGLALYLEEQAGVLDGSRLRTLAARVWVTDRMHGGESFGDSALALVREHAFDPPRAVALCERAHRGGGVARDAAYLAGLMRVRAAITAGEATVDELRTGKVGVADLPALRRLGEHGLHRPPFFRPSLAYSLDATDAGTNLLTSPPSVAASFTMLELT